MRQVGLKHLAYSVYINKWQWALVWFTDTSASWWGGNMRKYSWRCRFIWSCQLVVKPTSCSDLWIYHYCLFPHVFSTSNWPSDFLVKKKKKHFHIKQNIHIYCIYKYRFTCKLLFCAMWLFLYIYTKVNIWLCWMFYKEINMYIWQNQM